MFLFMAAKTSVAGWHRAQLLVQLHTSLRRSPCLRTHTQPVTKLWFPNTIEILRLHPLSTDGPRRRWADSLHSR